MLKMNLNLVGAIILEIMFIGQVMATEQFPDYLIYENDTLEIYTNPLESNIETLFKDTSFLLYTCLSTACWRGYQATWKLEGDKLYLLKIGDCCNQTLKADMNLLFGDKFTNNRVIADWYSGNLVIPIGKTIYGEHSGYSTVHEFEDILYLDKGEVTHEKRVDNRKTSIKYLSTDKLEIHLIKNLDYKILQEIWNKNLELFFYADVKCDEKRQVISVDFEEILEMKYRDKIKEIIYRISDWDILYRHGELADLHWLYPVKIDKKELKKKKEYWK